MDDKETFDQVKKCIASMNCHGGTDPELFKEHVSNTIKDFIRRNDDNREDFKSCVHKLDSSDVSLQSIEDHYTGKYKHVIVIQDMNEGYVED